MWSNMKVLQVITEISILATELNLFLLIYEFSKSLYLLHGAPA